MRKLNRSLYQALAASSALVCLMAPMSSSADITLADSPLFSSISVPGNLALTLSVEWPTANTPAYKSSSNAYAATKTYIGYFDPEKCYEYQYNTTTPSSSYFAPKQYAANHVCGSSSPALWSGNYLNWASMQSLDVFRWTLSGGARVVDTATQTILEKTYNTGQAGSDVYPDTAISDSSLITGATPFNWSVVRTSVQNYGNNTNYGTVMWVTATKPSTLSGATQEDYTGTGTTDDTKVYRMYVRVLVCDPTVGVESNCKQYGSNYKPEGLMQKYAMKLRYSAFGYINQGGKTRNGGVLRARMKYIGPNKPIPGSSDVTNSAAEWDATTGVMLQNPDSTDASATTSRASSEGKYSVTVSNSGVMNYLNKFGKVVVGTYKSNDPVSELYYAAVRYFKNLGNVPNFSSLSGSGSQSTLRTWIDGFPVITDWDDPILYSCQKNFILGIGDIYTWYDGGLPGSTLKANETVPSEVSSDSTVNVTAATNMVGKLEGLGNIGGMYYDTKDTTYGRADTYYIAGLAYDSHVKDIRSDLTGTQTINTYWMDVLEKPYVSKNQYWLATKYGGFTVPSGFSPYATSNGTSTIPGTAWYTTSDMANTNDHRPDNYFLADKPSAMVSGLNTAFSKIVAEAAAATSTTLSLPTPNIASSNSSDNYGATYDPSNWTGRMYKGTLSFNSDGSLNTNSIIWDLRDILTTTATTSRKIVTCCTSAGAGLPFQTTSLSGSLNSRTYYASFANVPGVAAASQSAANYVAYLRGDRTKEVANGGAYRTRSYLLGDIVNSKPVVVGAPSAPFTDASYLSFASTYASRQTVVYAGANDGMLHAAIDNGTTASEAFAYIPSFVYGDSSTASTIGLASLGNPTFTHHFFVDGLLQSFDVDFYKTPKATAATNDWHTILVGGLGKGGKGYFAIDVTDPTSWSNEAAVASKVLWEFTDSTMGYSYGNPMVFKTQKYGWVAVLTSGYNNSDGKGYFYFLDPRTGELLEKVATPEGSSTAPINLAYAKAFSPDYSTGMVDAIYAGDLRGNVWRLDLTASATTPATNYPSPVKIATLANAGGTAQPVTTDPLIELDTLSGSTKRYLVIGTGRMLADSDIASSDLQSIYVIPDGTRAFGGFYTSSTLPSGISFPVTRSNMESNPHLGGISSTPTNVMGWYYDLSSASNIAERITVNPETVNGIAAFAINLPNGSVCTPAGTSRVVAFRIGSGKTMLTNGVESISLSAVANSLAFMNIGGKTYLKAGDSGGAVSDISGNFDGASSYKRLNWRIIPTAD